MQSWFHALLTAVCPEGLDTAPPRRPELAPVWQQIITGQVTIEFEFLAARILQGTLARSYHQRPTAERLERCARELRELFLQNAVLPAAQNDLRRIRRQEPPDGL